MNDQYFKIIMLCYILFFILSLWNSKCILHILHTSQLELATFHVFGGSMWPEATCIGQPLLVDKCIKTALQTAF